MEVNNWKLLAYITKKNFKVAFSSRSDAFMNIIIMIINNFSFVFMWWVIFNSKGTINGWKFEHLLLMNAITNFAFGIYAIFFRGIEAIPQYIENGSLDNFLTTPRNSLFMTSTSESTVANWGDFITGIILLIMARHTSFADIFLFLILSFCCFITIFSFRLILSSLSFYKNNMDRLGHNFFMSFLVFSSLPASIFSGWYKVIFLSIIPAGFISLIPVNILTNFTWFEFVILILINILLFIIACLTFFLGLRNYSSGNKFGVR